LLAFMAMRMSSHSTVDDLASMRRWRQSRVAAAICLTAGDLICAVAAWISPWIGYAAGLITILCLLLLRSPPQVEDDFRRAAGAAAL